MPSNMSGMPCFDDAVHTPMTCPFCKKPLKFELFPEEQVPTTINDIAITGTLLFCSNPECRKLLGIVESKISEH